MSQKFISYLQKQKFKQGETLESEALIVAQKVLYNMGLSFIPDAYGKFLKQHNGIKAGDCYLFGATVDDDLDIIDQNKLMRKPDNTLLLGYNDFDLLCYNFKQKNYQIVDRNDWKVLETYDENDLDDALLHIFNI
ncbi:MAG: hypothetical protein J6Y91_05420 [Alphaproteobacteria bacterium]|nr:hypothetical protein [Alphaproteobacteria bacterium]